MLELSRVVRIPLGAVSKDGAGQGLVGAPSPRGLSPTVDLEVVCRGTPDSSGYLVDIGAIDRAVRALAQPLLREALLTELAAELVTTPASPPTTDPDAALIALLGRIAADLASELPAPIARIAYRPSPFRSIELELPATPHAEGTAMHAPLPTATLHETFEFAASHRLHLGDRSAEENRALFGKCNNPNGHGHNYRIEVAVEPSARFAGFDAIERCVECEIVARFDHRHLNLDCPEFRDLNPSVEHIARVCHGLLAPALAAEGGTLRFVRVWETDKTSCRYPA
jgi:6-pyruvoyl-tetrahydropterin synthase